MAACSYVPRTGETASSLIELFNCQARMLGAAGYQTLAAPGSSVSLLLTITLTILVALFGFRLLLDDTPTLRETVLTLVKIGVVLALASSWPAYRTLVFDVVIDGPGQLSAEVSGSLDLPGAGGTLPRHLDNIDNQFESLEALRTGRLVAEQSATFSGAVATGGFDGFAVGLARTLFLASTIGALATLKLAGGLLLALGPLFAAFLLFEATRGLFEGWLRGLVAVVLGSVATAVLLGIELSVFEPWLADLIGRRATGEAVVTGMTPLLATVAMFGIVSAALLLLCLRIGFSLALPPRVVPIIRPTGQPTSLRSIELPAPTSGIPLAAAGRSRAGLIADSVAAAQRREEHLIQAMTVATSRTAPSAAQPGTSTGSGGSPVPLGSSFRRTIRRVSASGRARDVRR